MAGIADQMVTVKMVGEDEKEEGMGVAAVARRRIWRHHWQEGGEGEEGRGRGGEEEDSVGRMASMAARKRRRRALTGVTRRRRRVWWRWQ